MQSLDKSNWRIVSQLYKVSRLHLASAKATTTPVAANAALSNGNAHACVLNGEIWRACRTGRSAGLRINVVNKTAVHRTETYIGQGKNKVCNCGKQRTSGACAAHRVRKVCVPTIAKINIYQSASALSPTHAAGVSAQAPNCQLSRRRSRRGVWREGSRQRPPWPPCDEIPAKAPRLPLAPSLKCSSCSMLWLQQMHRLLKATRCRRHEAFCCAYQNADNFCKCEHVLLHVAVHSRKKYFCMAEYATKRRRECCKRKDKFASFPDGQLWFALRNEYWTQILLTVQQI